MDKFVSQNDMTSKVSGLRAISLFESILMVLVMRRS